MLSEQDRYALAEIERGLASDHPDLPRIMARRHPRPPLRPLVLILVLVLWTAATIAAAVRSWPTAIVPAAVELVAVAVFLLVSRRCRRRGARA